MSSFLTPCLSAQSTGFPPPFVWYAAGENAPQLVDRMAVSLPISGQAVFEVNGHAVLESPAVTAPIELPGNGESVSIFTVYFPVVGKEECVWSIYADDTTRQVMTTKWLADLQVGKYLQLPEVGGGVLQSSRVINGQQSGLRQLGHPILRSYVQQKNKATAGGKSHLKLGGHLGTPALPATAFSGGLAEILVYDRQLNPEDRQRVESYLAIKYGISLAQDEPRHLLAADGSPRWDALRNRAYPYRIAGVVNSESLNLRQDTARSYAPESGLLTIGIETSTDQPTTPWITWSDNGKPTAVESGSGLRKLERRWVMECENLGENQGRRYLGINTAKLFSQPKKSEQYWLLITTDSEASFSPATTTYFSSNREDEDGVLHFDEIEWPVGERGRTFFTLAIGPTFLARIWSESETCAAGGQGRLFVATLGGEAPFRFTVKDQAGQLINTAAANETGYFEVSNLAPGRYEAVIEDGQGQKYREEIRISAIDAPNISVADQYELPTNGPLNLRAYERPETGVDYQWTDPNGRVYSDFELLLNMPGRYYLIADRDGCTQEQTFTVNQRKPDFFRSVVISPNPSTDGHFQLRSILAQAAPLTLTAIDVQGREVWQSTASATTTHHLISGELTVSGTYLLRLQTRGQVFTTPFIVQ